MFPRSLIRLPMIFLLALALVGAGFAQINTEPPTIPPIPKSNGSGWAIGAAAASVAAMVLFLLSRRPPNTIVGCLRQEKGDYTLTDEHDKQTYILEIGSIGPNPGDRVKLKGRKAKDKAGQRVFIVQNISRDYGACGKTEPSAANRASATPNN